MRLLIKSLRQVLRESGFKVVWLDANPKELFLRLNLASEVEQRPLIQDYLGDYKKFFDFFLESFQPRLEHFKAEADFRVENFISFL